MWHNPWTYLWIYLGGCWLLAWVLGYCNAEIEGSEMQKVIWASILWPLTFVLGMAFLVPVAGGQLIREHFDKKRKAKAEAQAKIDEFLKPKAKGEAQW